jgi:hypothetical protein
MLPEGLEECPRCGAHLGKPKAEDEPEVSRSEIFWYSTFTIGIVLIPIVIGVAIGLVCILLFTLN